MRRRLAFNRLRALALALALGSPVPAALAQAAPARPARKPPGVLLDVPFIAQREKNGCGAAALAMLMQYWEKQAAQPTAPRADPRLIERTLDPRDRGIANTAMESYLRAAGFRVFAFSGRWADLRQNLPKGRPLVVALAPKGGAGPLHYVVIAGIDWERNFVFVNDPAGRKLFRMARRRFLQEWQGTGNWTLLAVPKEPA